MNLTIRQIIHALESKANNTDTDPRWLAASKLRELNGWDEAFQTVTVNTKLSETHSIGEFHIGQYTLTHCTMGGIFVRRKDSEGGVFPDYLLEKAIIEFYERNF